MTAAAPTVGVLALQGDVREHLGHLRAAGADAVPVRRPDELAAVSGLVIPGGESTTMSRLLDVFGLTGPLRERLAAGLPVYGSCAGMILLASEVIDDRPDVLVRTTCLGAIDMTVRRNAFGRQVDSFEGDVAMPALGERPVHAVFIRAPWVESVGDGAEVLARVTASDGREHVVAVRQGNAVATSFHPEVTDDTRVHEYFVDLVRRAGSPRATS